MSEPIRFGWERQDPPSPVVLLCAERDHRECHRTEVAETLANVLRACGLEVEVEHL